MKKMLVLTAVLTLALTGVFVAGCTAPTGSDTPTEQPEATTTDAAPAETATEAPAPEATPTEEAAPVEAAPVEAAPAEETPAEVPDLGALGGDAAAAPAGDAAPADGGGDVWDELTPGNQSQTQVLH